MSFIQALEADAHVRGVGDAAHYENVGLGRGWGGGGGLAEPPIIKKIMTNFFFIQILVTISVVQLCFFHDFKYLMNFLSISFEIFQKYLSFKAPNFF